MKIKSQLRDTVNAYYCYTLTTKIVYFALCIHNQSFENVIINIFHFGGWVKNRDSIQNPQVIYTKRGKYIYSEVTFK